MCSSDLLLDFLKNQYFFTIKIILLFNVGAIMYKEKNTIVVVVGATGSGKSNLGVILAKHFDGEVVSVDSMQIYKVTKRKGENRRNFWR